MAVAWLSSGGVDQMVGYVVSTWYGRGGWGTRDYFFSEPGRYTLSEAFYFNNQAITWQLQTRFPKVADVDFNEWNIETDPRLLGRLAGELGYTEDAPDLKDNLGLHWDHDTVAFYGDPAWEARLAPQPAKFTQKLTIDGDRYTFTIHADNECTSGRPPAMLLPRARQGHQDRGGPAVQAAGYSQLHHGHGAGQAEKGRDSQRCLYREGRPSRSGRGRSQNGSERGCPARIPNDNQPTIP